VRKNRKLVGIYTSLVIAIAVCSIACLMGLSFAAPQLPFFDRPRLIIGAGTVALAISLLIYWLLWQKSDGTIASAMSFWRPEFEGPYEQDQFIVHPFAAPLRQSIAMYDCQDRLLAFIKKTGRRSSEVHMANGFWQIGPQKGSDGCDIHWTDIDSQEQIFIGKLFTRIFGANRIQLLTGGTLSIRRSGWLPGATRNEVIMAGKSVGEFHRRGVYRFSLFKKTIPQSVQVLAMAMIFAEA
jgi:hypothetical protein